jgi:hypothetical protein
VSTKDLQRATHARAKALFSRIKPFDEWVRDTDPEILAGVEKLHGDLRAFYDRFKAELVKLCGLSAQGSSNDAADPERLLHVEPATPMIQ